MDINTNRSNDDYVSRLYELFDQSGSFNMSNGIKYINSLLDNYQQTNVAGTTEYGWWTIQKHMFLQSYLWPFFTIGRKYFKRIVYIDMFAGPGLNLINEDNFPYVSPGSPLIVYAYKYTTKKEKRTDRFDSYYFFEKNSAKASILKKRLEKIKSDFKYEEEPIVLTDDSVSSIFSIINKEVTRLNLPKKTPDRGDSGLLFLIFIDPEGLELDWNTLKKLIRRYYTKKGKQQIHYMVADIIYTIPIGSLKREGKKFFERNFGIKDVDPAKLSYDKIIELIYSQMKEEVGNKIYIETIPVYNTKNVLLYDISLITKTEGTSNATRSIIQKFKTMRLNPKQIESKIQIAYGKIKSLDSYS
ncbi:MAG: three-Cys-motif partner protein TcmP [Caldisphaera sp.]